MKSKKELDIRNDAEKYRAFITGEDHCLHELIDFDEKVLQIVWNESLWTGPLFLKDERYLEVLSPGIWNWQSGPDFFQASLKIDGELVQGKVELHLRASDWFQHGHQHNADYEDVCLHVVWSDEAGGPNDIPILALQDFVEESILEKIRAENYGRESQIKEWPGAEGMKALSDDEVLLLLRAAGYKRLMRKTQCLQYEILKYGFEQALYRAFFEALGYKNNRLAFRRLSEKVPWALLKEKSPKERGAILWGVSGFLPDPSQDEIAVELQAYVHELWLLWWPIREEFTEELPWDFSLTRPLNTPCRRLAAGLAFLAKINWNWLEFCEEFAEGLSDKKSLKSFLGQCFELESPLSAFYDFKRPLKKSSCLIGKSRQNDLLYNIFLPALFSRLGQDDFLLINYCLDFPKLATNSSLEIAGLRFLLPRERQKKLLKHALEQQGLLELYQDFATRSSQDFNDLWRKLGLEL